MRVLLVYASHYGATKGIAERIGETLREEGLEVDLKAAEDDFGHLADKEYDAFVVGSAIHAGHWLPSAADFVRHNRDVLAARPSWLFSSGPIGEKYVHQPQPDPPEIAEFRRALDLHDHVVFAGAFDPESADLARVGWLERQIASRLMPVGDFRDWPEIERWATAIVRELRGAVVA
jgi:menaquinone-dependent protoporphyrinogen oxidase